jgi:hypothetical protein
MSSKRRIRRNKCTSKVRHPDQSGAMVAIYKVTKKMGGAIGLMQLYKCSFCGGWHIGHAKSARW